MDSARQLLNQILMGGTLADKLTGLNLAPASLDWESGWESRFEAPDQPGRVGVLAPRETSDADRFPKKSDLMGADSLRHRGRILHFFANHELLAIETMAFTLLRFHNAPVEFKQGVFRILQEEQAHLSGYIERMKEYGVEMGEVPLNFYFWNSLKTLQSPIDFVTRMSLTFEQANLDFALEYARYFERELDDEKTASLLQKVHDDEITHVAHGLYWFNRWRKHEQGVRVDARAQGMSEWDDYRSRLPFPMSARRARGGSAFFAEESRRKAGFSEDFIASVRITGGSRGRVPDLYLFNPQCEIEATGVKFSKAFRDKMLDFEPVLFWFAQESDLILQEREPPKKWLREVFEWRGELPEWVKSVGEIQRPVATIQPWGWGRSAFDLQTALLGQLKKPQALTLADFEQKLLSKAWWKRALSTAGAIISNLEELRAFFASRGSESPSWILKAEHSTSGRGHRVIKSADEIKEWKNGVHVIEPFYEKQIDFSVQYEMLPGGKLKSYEPRFFETDGRQQYVSSWLGAAATEPRRSFQRILEAQEKSWIEAHQRVALILREMNYVGPFGIDGLIAKVGEDLQVVPVIEVNVRLTMGRLAHEIEALLRSRGIFQAQMRLYTQCSSPAEWGKFAAELKREHGDRVLFVTPPELAQSSWIAVTYAQS